MNNIRLGELKGVFDDLEVIFDRMQIDFYLIGALAKEVWYSDQDSSKEQPRTLILRS